MRRVAPVRESRTGVALLPWVFLAPARTETKMDLTGKPPYKAQMRLYQDWLRDQRGLKFTIYDALWRWLTTDVGIFKQSIWDYFEMQSPTPHRAALARYAMPGAQWFGGAQVSSAAQALRHVDAVHAAGLPAIVSSNEKGQQRELS